MEEKQEYVMEEKQEWDEFLRRLARNGKGRIAMSRWLFDKLTSLGIPENTFGEWIVIE